MPFVFCFASFALAILFVSFRGGKMNSYRPNSSLSASNLPTSANKFLKFCFSLALLSFVSSEIFISEASAQQRRPRPVRIDLDNMDFMSEYRFRAYNCGFDIGGGRQERIQDRYCEDTYQNQEQVKACNLALMATRVAARARVAPDAAYDGLKGGLNCGITQGLRDGHSNYSYERGRDLSYSLVQEIENDSNRVIYNNAQIPADQAANSSAQSQVYGEFREATHTNRKPNYNNIILPMVQYEGIQDGYELNSHRVQTTEEALNELYSDSYFRIDEIVDRIDELSDWHNSFWNTNYRYSQFTQRSDFLPPAPPSNPYDSIWLRLSRMRRSPAQIQRLVQRWESLSDEQIIAEDQFAIGRPNPGQIPNPENPNLVVPEPVKLDSPKKVFADSFARMYRLSHNLVYGRILKQSLDQAYPAGLEAGKEVGERISYQEGQKYAYDQLVRNKSIQVYTRTFNDRFPAFAQSHYQKLNSTSYLEDFKYQIMAGVADGIFTPGEKLGFSFSIANIGGRGTKLNVSGGFNTQNANSANSYEIAATTKKSYVTEAFLSIPSNAIPLSERSANVQLKFNVDKFNQTQNLQVFNESGFDSNSAVAKIEKLIIEVPVTVSNPSNTANSKESTLNLYMNGQLVGQKKLGKLNPGSQSLSFQVALDFFAILDQTYSLQLELIYGTQRLQFKENMLVSINKREALKTYFQALVNAENASVPQGQSMSAYKDRLVQYIIQDARLELQTYMEQAKLAVDDSESLRFASKNDIWAIYRGRPKNDKPSILADIVALSPYVQGRDAIRRMNAEQKRVYDNFANQIAILMIEVSKKADQVFTKQSLRERFMKTTCDAAVLSHSMMKQEKPDSSSSYQLEFYSSSSNQLYYCWTANSAPDSWLRDLKRKYRSYFQARN